MCVCFTPKCLLTVILPLGELRSLACVQLLLDVMVLTLSVACPTLHTRVSRHVSVAKTPLPAVS